MSSRSRSIAIVIGLVVATVAAYARVIHFESVSYDDPDFIATPQAQEGLTPQSVRWALTSVVASNWHPVTMLSHLLDVELFGQRPGLHHLTNLVFHVANTLLLFTLLRQLTGAIWRSALVAALFALHPLHVESVAWIAERKDVLSTFFFLLTLMAYGWYARRPSALKYALTLVLFALGLMSKPMLVTVPGVMLVMDYWPLKRPQRWGRLAVEKLPLVALAIADAVVTFVLQQQTGAVAPIERVSLSMRLANAIVSYVRYLWMTIWPADLAVFYPYPDRWPAVVVIAALALLVAITIVTVRQARARAYLIVGWLWSLGTLVPVIGIVQVGHQALADRYTYIPLIGPFIALAWAAEELARRSKNAARIACAFAAFALAALSILTFIQVRHWRNSLTLFAHAVDVTDENWLAYNHLATALREAGRVDEAVASAQQVVRIRPNWAIGHFNLGNTLMQAGDADGAIAAFQRAIQLRPNFAQAHNNLGLALVMSDRLEEAIEHFRAAVEADAQSPQWRKNLEIAQRRLNERSTQ